MFENKWKDRSIEDMLKEIEREFGKGKGKELEEEIYREIDTFWDL